MGPVTRTRTEMQRRLDLRYKGSVKFVRHVDTDFGVFHCKKCRQESTVRMNNACRGFACLSDSCRKRIWHTPESYRALLKPRKIRVLEDYVNARTRIKHGCLNCGCIWHAFPDNILTRNTGCPACSREEQSKSFKGVTVKMGGKDFRLQGFEPQALAHMKKKGLDTRRLLLDAKSGKPSFRYRYKKRSRVYIPDFFDPKKNQVIEVKSTWTLFGRYNAEECLFRMASLKARAVLAEGYRFKMMLMSDSGVRIKLPKHWYLMKRSAVLRELGINVRRTGSVK